MTVKSVSERLKFGDEKLARRGSSLSLKPRGACHFFVVSFVWSVNVRRSSIPEEAVKPSNNYRSGRSLCKIQGILWGNKAETNEPGPGWHHVNRTWQQSTASNLVRIAKCRRQRQAASISSWCHTWIFSSVESAMWLLQRNVVHELLRGLNYVRRSHENVRCEADLGGAAQWRALKTCPQNLWHEPGRPSRRLDTRCSPHVNSY